MLALDELYKLLPPAELEQWAVEYGIGSDVCARLPGYVVFICLLNTLLNHPLATQRLLEEAWREQTGRTTDHSSFSRALSALDPRRFDPCDALGEAAGLWHSPWPVQRRSRTFHQERHRTG
jgi:hypothetical protein